MAERLLEIGAERNVPYTIYRPGFIGGATTNGASNSTDTVSRFIDACFELGCVPEIDSQVSMIPVDFLSRTIVSLAKRASSSACEYNLMHPEQVNFRDITGIMVAMGLAPQGRVSSVEWLARCAENPLTQALPAVLAPPPNVRAIPPADVTIPNEIEEQVRAGRGCPAIDEQLLRKYIAWRHALRLASSAALVRTRADLISVSNT